MGRGMEKGSVQVHIVFLSWGIIFVKANSADPDAPLYFATAQFVNVLVNGISHQETVY